MKENYLMANNPMILDFLAKTSLLFLSKLHCLAGDGVVQELVLSIFVDVQKSGGASNTK